MLLIFLYAKNVAYPQVQQEIVSAIAEVAKEIQLPDYHGPVTDSVDANALDSFNERLLETTTTIATTTSSSKIETAAILTTTTSHLLTHCDTTAQLWVNVIPPLICQDVF